MQAGGEFGCELSSPISLPFSTVQYRPPIVHCVHVADAGWRKTWMLAGSTLTGEE